MKASDIKYGVLLCLLLFVSAVMAQNNNGIVPDYIVVQHAGSIGYMSAGAGYNLFREDKGNLDFSYGVVPESKGGPLNIVTAKFAYRAVEIAASKGVRIYPLNPGLFFSYHLNKQFDIAFDREQYGKSYYGWSTAIRGHLSVSNEIRFNIGQHAKPVSIYSEFNASDLYLASLFYQENRKWLKPTDIIKLGIGIRVGL
jgi:hypothetical protein